LILRKPFGRRGATLIADASVLVWASLPVETEPERTRIRDVLRRISVHEPLRAPALAACEVGNVIHRKRARDAGANLEARQGLLRAALNWVELALPSHDVLDAAGFICERHKISFYDATYLAHAGARGESLVTADHGLYSHAKSIGIRSYCLPDDLPRMEEDWPAKTDSPP
jgi:predicted nucleic acid-binding protein